jgi:L-rhamnose isomerase / sugar isomerase
MQIDKSNIVKYNELSFNKHVQKLAFISSEIKNSEFIIQKLVDFQIAIPSWALGTGGTRFGRFAGGGEPSNLEDKLSDIGLLHSLNSSSGAVSLHIPWDVPADVNKIKTLASGYGLKFDAVNSNTFQNQPNQALSYKFGSLQNVNKQIRKQAIAHNIEVIQQGIALGSKSLTVWLADGSNFPGQLNFRKAFENTLESLQEIYTALPDDWKMFVEYKSNEPNFYSTTIADWGQSYMYASKLGSKALTLVDLGHHLPNANIEQIVSLLLMEGKLGGFHFNDSKYGDDDLTVGSIKPYQLFLIFNELIEGMDAKNMNHATDLGWMIDASHNVKDPLEDLLQSVEAIMIAYAQALLVDREQLSEVQNNNDVVQAQEILQNAFRTDTRALVAEARLRSGGALNPLEVFRKEKVREKLILERGYHSTVSGL